MDVAKKQERGYRSPYRTVEAMKNEIDTQLNKMNLDPNGYDEHPNINLRNLILLKILIALIYKWSHRVCNRFKDAFSFILYSISEGRFKFSNLNNLRYYRQLILGMLNNYTDGGKWRLTEDFLSKYSNGKITYGEFKKNYLDKGAKFFFMKLLTHARQRHHGPLEIVNSGMVLY